MECAARPGGDATLATLVEWRVNRVSMHVWTGGRAARGRCVEQERYLQRLRQQEYKPERQDLICGIARADAGVVGKLTDMVNVGAPHASVYRMDEDSRLDGRCWPPGGTRFRATMHGCGGRAAGRGGAPPADFKFRPCGSGSRHDCWERRPVSGSGAGCVFHAAGAGGAR